MTAIIAMQEGTLTPKDASGILTLTGWTASLGLLALVIVAFGGLIWGYRRYYGLDGPKGYNRVVKARDASAPPGML